jgi:DNA-binding LacI/PurR family transcriptional regulator/DNA-binding transcriptional regulator YhcF (GntR family)
MSQLQLKLDLSQDKSKQPLYLSLKESLQNYIEENDISAGTHFFSLRQIAEAGGVSRITAQKAIKELVESGILEERPKRGTVVAENKLICDESFGVILSKWDKPQQLAWDNGMIIPAMLEEAFKYGISLDFIPYVIAAGDSAKFDEYIRKKDFKGLIWIGMRENATVTAARYLEKIPQLALQTKPDNLPVPFITEDNCQGTIDAIELLLSEGHSNIAIINASNRVYCYGQRQKALEIVLKKHNMECLLKNCLEIPEAPRNSWHYETIKSFLLTIKPTAILLLTPALDDTLKAYYECFGNYDVDLISFESPEMQIVPPKASFRYFEPDFKLLGEMAIAKAVKIRMEEETSFDLMPMKLKTYSI